MLTRPDEHPCPNEFVQVGIRTESPLCAAVTSLVYQFPHNLTNRCIPARSVRLARPPKTLGYSIVRGSPHQLTLVGHPTRLSAALLRPSILCIGVFVKIFELSQSPIE